MRDPQILNAYDLIDRPRLVLVGLQDGAIRPARGEGYSSIRYRLRAAWLVWTGRADALVWPGQER